MCSLLPQGLYTPPSLCLTTLPLLHPSSRKSSLTPLYPPLLFWVRFHFYRLLLFFMTFSLRCQDFINMIIISVLLKLQAVLSTLFSSSLPPCHPGRCPAWCPLLSHWSFNGINAVRTSTHISFTIAEVTHRCPYPTYVRFVDNFCFVFQ